MRNWSNALRCAVSSASRILSGMLSCKDRSLELASLTASLSFDNITSMRDCMM
jgi:hypothetical protein